MKIYTVVLNKIEDEDDFFGEDLDLVCCVAGTDFELCCVGGTDFELCGVGGTDFELCGVGGTDFAGGPSPSSAGIKKPGKACRTRFALFMFDLLNIIPL